MDFERVMREIHHPQTADDDYASAVMEIYEATERAYRASVQAYGPQVWSSSTSSPGATR